MRDLTRILTRTGASLREVIEAIDRGAAGIALLVDEERRLVGTITDGDVRRAILGGASQDEPVAEILKRRAKEYGQPVVASARATRSELLALMRSKSIRHVPLLDDEGRVADLVLLSDFVEQTVPPMSAMIMAGGFGRRLHPLTEDTPKPMLPLGGRPLMERTIEQVRDAGIRRVIVSTHHKPGPIAEHFGDGSGLGVAITYAHEEQPLGTAGALGLIPVPDETLLVVNGDILTQVSFRALYDFHREHNADMTVSVGKYAAQVPYGVVETDGVQISRLVEKPSFEYFVNAGIYLLEPSVFEYVPRGGGERFDMTDLIQRLIGGKRTVVSFPITEYWLDIGRHADYERAQEDHSSGKI